MPQFPFHRLGRFLLASTTVGLVWTQLYGLVHYHTFPMPLGELWTGLRSLQINLAGHKGSVNSLAISSNGTILASAGSDKTIRLWKLESGEPLRIISTESYISSNTLAITPDQQFIINGKFIVNGSGNPTIQVWNLNTGEKVRNLTGHRDTIKSIAISQDGKIVLSDSYDDTIRVQQFSSGASLCTLKYSNIANGGPNPHRVALSPDGQLLAAMTAREIQLWRIKGCRKERTIANNTPPTAFNFDNPSAFPFQFATVAFSPNGKLIAGSAAENQIKLWQVSTGDLVQTLTGSTKLVSMLAFSGKGDRLVSTNGADRLIRIWDLQTGKAQTLRNPSNSIGAIALSQDGQTMVTGGGDGIIRVWHINP